MKSRGIIEVVATSYVHEVSEDLLKYMKALFAYRGAIVPRNISTAKERPRF